MKDLNKYMNEIEDIDTFFSKKAREREDILTKPNGSLGKLEEIAIEIAAMKREEIPKIHRKVIFTLAGDHGVVEEGVSAYPQEVTSQMIYNFIEGGAAINILASHAGSEIIVADFGVASELNIAGNNFRNRKINYGTKNIAKEPAMTKEEAIKSIMTGIILFEEEYKKEKIDLVGIGEMGIGNTTPATTILAVINGEKIETIVDRGTGISDKGLKRKIAAIKKAIKLHKPEKDNGIDILQKVGGYEIGGLTGIILAAARNRTPILIDGFISTSAALIAKILNPVSISYIIASHKSKESGHEKMLEILKKKPILNLDLRLGEGSGAALAMNIVESAIKILNKMATFESAGISKKK